MTTRRQPPDEPLYALATEAGPDVVDFLLSGQRALAERADRLEAALRRAREELGYVAAGEVDRVCVEATLRAIDAALEDRP